MRVATANWVCQSTRPKRVPELARWFGIIAGLLAPLNISAQNAPAIPQQLAVLGTDFTMIRSVRELSDGRVLVVEHQKHFVLTLLNPATQKKTRVGGIGDGPGEYRSLSALQAVEKDSTLLLEGAGKRWQLLRRDSVITLPDAAREKRSPDMLGYAGMDLRWNWLEIVGLGGKDVHSRSAPSYADSIGLIRFTLNGKKDTLARLKGYNFGRTSRDPIVNGVGGMTFEVANPLSTYEQAALFPDGSIAIALLNPYRLDWILANGIRIKGKPLESSAPLTAKAKQLLVSQHMRNNDGSAIFTERDFTPFPRDVPPFMWHALHAGADGRLYVLRTIIDIDGPSTYDVFDRAGNRSQFRLPDRALLIGSGSRGLYVTLKDDDDVLSLALFKYPP